MGARGRSWGGSSASVTKLRETRRTQILLLGDNVRQVGSVANMASGAYPAQYMGGTTDAEVYDTAPGYLTILGGVQPNNKALYIAKEALQWELQSGQSLLFQMRFKVAALPVGAQHLIGNSSSGGGKGLLLALTPSGALQPYIKVSDAAIQNIGTASTAVTANIDTSLTIWIDGASRVVNGWINGIQQPAWTNKVITPGSTGRYDSYDATIPFMVGNSSSPATPPARDATALSLRALRVLVVESGKTINNAPLLDFAFRTNPMSIFNDADVELV